VFVGLTTLLWSLGLPSLHSAEASNDTAFKVTLSDSASAVAANHTITFVTPAKLTAGETISIVFPTGFSGIGELDYHDFDLSIGDTDVQLAADATEADWGVQTTGQTIDIKKGMGTIDAGSKVSIEIGTHATFQSTGNSQITNPAGTASHEVNISFDKTDTSSTRVVIVEADTNVAYDSTLFTFTVSGVAAATRVNSTDTTGGATTATNVPFGKLSANSATTAAQSLAVSTNASNGFVVTVQVDTQLESANGADIDGFRNGNFYPLPVPWESPGATPGNENEYGHWGLSSVDTTLTAGLSDLYSGGDNFVPASTTPVEVFRHDGPSNGTGIGEGTTDVIYKLEASSLQEEADDYTAALTYLATPVF